MEHFAELDENNVVLRVIVVANEELMENGVESEHKGIAFCKTLLGNHTNWVQTSYNAKIRKNYAGIDYIYDAENDYFFAPQPFPSWELNADAQWEAPVAYPTDGEAYTWNENKLEWVQLTVGN
jgi:hypothetical protein